jgi:hypothetical protein
MKSNTFLIIAGVIVLTTLLWITFSKKPTEKPQTHECQTQDGYTWDEYVKACIKNQTIQEENKKKAAKIAVEHIGTTKGLTVTQVDATTTDGVFLIHLTKNGETTQIALNNWQVTTGKPNENPTTPKIIPLPTNGIPDEHGCIGTALYIWNEEIGACTRIRELTDENQKKAAKTAVDYIGYEKGTSVLGVDTLNCPGCYTIHLYKGGNRIDVYITNLKPTGKTITLKECETTGGRITTTNETNTQCQPNEKETGKIAGYLKTTLCCTNQTTNPPTQPV